MVTRTRRNIVYIDEEKCTGCGACIISCAEGALKIIDGKAKLVSERYCDGLGNCLDCPEGAITIREREAEEFDEAAVELHLQSREEESFPAPGCPSAGIIQMETEAPAAETARPVLKSVLGHWPVQLALVPPDAPFLKGADLVLAADCVAYAYGDFHREFLGENRALLVACPKLDDFPVHQQRLNEVLKESGLRSLTVLHMEVPCCSGLVHLARQAILASANAVPFRDVTISIRGEKREG
ncbi:MAG: 4Fe-4S ferredoxin [Chloroflexi bacterium RBG_16_56_11]|nr:MAG: 4Fe-4S ferredoxin [Chloroflexi bacterium RBG_16_56_11]